MSPDLGRTRDPDRRTDLLQMYRTAISYLESLHDPSVEPLRLELTALERKLRVAEQQERARPEPIR